VILTLAFIISYRQRLLKEKPGMEKSEVDFDTEDWEAEADAMFEVCMNAVIYFKEDSYRFFF
jgi:hypothetical protein